MSEGDLRQLQKLGIDVWLPPEQAQLLFDTGKARPLVGNTLQQAAPVVTHQVREPVQPPASAPSSRRPPLPQRRPSQASSPEAREPAEAKQHAPQPPQAAFEVSLSVFIYGVAAVVIEKSLPRIDSLVTDIALAINEFEPHNLNELYFDFPIRLSSSQNAVKGTVEGAQQGFKAWFSKAADRVETIVSIGAKANQTAAAVAVEQDHLIALDEVPVSADAKRELWARINPLLS